VMLLARRLLSLLLAAAGACAQNPDPSTLEGKVLLGYQGWFRCPGGGAMGTNWSHWANGAPTAASLVIDIYPDLREFEPGEAGAVPGMTSGGNPAYLFSSGNSKTVERHFRWMRQYGLDGVLVQRFVTDIAGSPAGGDVALRNVMAAVRARLRGRVRHQRRQRGHAPPRPARRLEVSCGYAGCDRAPGLPAAQR
jgi:hypothetical protein